ncbi:N-6 DNA methylase [Amycolatopsis regifaucium]|uniref:SAM-dependent methyltransferase n=1 Tax=Amycolatopsis regifaucium TaxID=546365 RepID=A0A154MN05_9PSEU|nr:N-6 DNA methylase [Amycolatopsis regifaucium]KZB85227.1 SAM-dependent methyltransferase [Amycolatopsis regifaucium]OKA03795.1 SAM-dependent methyltransferase [Amycolatopsis regifaucium]SFH89635.1 Type I restriction-modification system, DNA methylase subunit [Amycolatopsis regifaucium]
MEEQATVSAADIAHIAGVGRAAVSNWRRRYGDFPPPVGGTASSPLFSLPAVEKWLRERGKPFEISLGDRIWQRLRNLGDDLSLGLRVGRVGTFLTLRGTGKLNFDTRYDDPELLALVDRFADELGARQAYEFLCDRYVEAHSRQLSRTPEPVAALMSRLIGPAPGVVLDPACGLGTLLLASGGTRLLGQDADPTVSCIAAQRLLLAGAEMEMYGADALSMDSFEGLLADAVVCDPPFNEREWGYDELVGDPRWEYGQPPRGEPELAWVQHCLAHVKPGGLVAIRMPLAAAGRRTGRRIRGNLLRAGALRAIVTVGGADLWLLRRPKPGERSPSRLLLLADPSTVEEQWPEHLRGAEVPGAVPIIDLLDEEIDLSPARHQARDEHAGEAFLELRRRFEGIRPEPPSLAVSDGKPAFTTVAELLKSGVLSVPETVEEGDVVTSPAVPAYVHSGPPVDVEPSMSKYRTDPERLDAAFFAGCLRAAGQIAPTSSTRIDLKRTRIPRLPIETQRAHGEAFTRLAEFEDALREAAESGLELVRLGLAGLTEGQLIPEN